MSVNLKFTCFLATVIVAVLLLVSVTVAAQGASGITGEVLDDTGGVLPGVTVTAASPALIDQQRIAISDGQGRYTFIDLRPGTYSVTFTLPGFNTMIREGVELTAGFTATIDVELNVGGIEETITVTGASPVVDVQNVRQQAVLTNDLIATLPSGTNGFMGVARMIPGMSGGTDTGGASGIYSSNSAHGATLHGKGGGKMSYDGMQTSNLSGTGHTSYVMNPSTVLETVVEAGGISAESDASGFRINLIPKEGGNTFSTTGDFTFTNQDLQADNLSDVLRDRGVNTTNKVLKLYDANATLGGPIKRDKVWFFLATRFSGNKNQVTNVFFNKTRGTPLYTPDLDKPAFRKEWLKSQAGRITLQVSERNKLNGFVDIQSYMTRGRGNFVAPEAQTVWSFWPNGLFQVGWTSTVSSRILIEGAISLAMNGYPSTHEQATDTFDFVVPRTDVSILEASTGFRYNARNNYQYTNDENRYAERFSVSYVTGTHSFKTGFTLQQHIDNLDRFYNSDGRNTACADCPVDYIFLRGVPTQLTQWAWPAPQSARTKADLGIYFQDQWAIDRLTLNYGLRLDYFNGFVPAQHADAGPFVGARDFEKVDNVPNWTDLNPRLGLSYDLFGNGRTALKVSLGRYVGKMATAVASANNPIATSVLSTRRNWSDANGDFIPDCDLKNFAANGECGALANENFGQSNPNAVQYDDELIRGFGSRDYLWDVSAEVQQELRPGVSLLVGYYRNWTDHYGDGLRSYRGETGWPTYEEDNLALNPEDYDPFCITAPVDSRLPNGGGYEVCGLYDVAPEKFGVGNRLRVKADKSRVADFITLSMNTRLGNEIELGGSLDMGRIVDDHCFVLDSPQQQLNCEIISPFKGQTQLKMFWSYPLPGAWLVSGVFQNVSGIQYEANYRVRNDAIAPSLGRNLAACGTRTVCTSSVTVPLLMPFTEFEPRRSLLDLRLTKVFTLGAGQTFKANFDIYNVLNDSSLTRLNNSYGSSWKQPQGGAFSGGIVDGRLIQFGAQLAF